MSEESIFLKQKFAEYYRDNIKHIQPPESFMKREFGFILYKEKMMIRHKSFQSLDAFKNFFISSAPLDIYYSSAYYEMPQESMEKKGWLGADLTFDIDSDHLKTHCQPNHVYWTCKSCDNAGTGKQPKICPRCEGSSFKEEAWLCDTCLNAAKKETLKLVKFLTEDFGFPSEDIEVCFSGQRGYHVRVSQLDVRQFNQTARKEIVDYVSGTGLMIEQFGWVEHGRGKTREVIGPKLSEPGWHGKIAQGVYDLLSSFTLEQIPGIKKTIVNALYDNRELILKNWDSGLNLGTIKGLDSNEMKKIIQYIIDNHRVSSVIDSVVTTDLHRLIRLPFSLHSKTGLMAVDVPLNNLNEFNPLKEAIAFKQGTLKIFVNESYRFRVGDEEFSPFLQQNVELPTAAAIYLLCKKAAVLAKNP
ncbi:MAG: DNA primase small subunit PriS [Candidatus Bathyarchaeota archaeon]